MTWGKHTREQGQRVLWRGMLLLAIGCIFLASVQIAYAADQTGIVAATALNVRSGPGSNYTSLGLLSINQEIPILDSTTGTDGRVWYRTEYKGKTGYVCGDYIILSGGSDYEYDASFESYLNTQGFPESYKPYLRSLHAKYPNWVFRGAKTGLSWSAVLQRESQVGTSLVPSSSVSSWKSKDPAAFDAETGKYVIFDSGGWVAASEEIVAYYLDPRNFLNQVGIFQFLTHSYDAATQTREGLSYVLTGTFLDAVFPEDGFATYGDALMEAGRISEVNPYVLASMILVEQGSSGTGKSISGTVSGYEGFYNYYNIGAYKTASMSAVTRGLWYASQSGSYNRPWDSHYDAILGGALFYGETYAKQNKNTLYFKKWNVMNGQQNVGIGQYMTNVQGAESEAAALRKGYVYALNSPMTFLIPIYDGMPSAAAVKPTANDPVTPQEPQDKKEQTVTTAYTKYNREVGGKGFNLKAKTNGDGALSYVSSDPAIAAIDQTGTVTLTGGVGTVRFTVTAAETETYQAGSKVVTLTVKKSAQQEETERREQLEALKTQLRLKASSSKTAAGSIKVTLSLTKGDVESIAALGYTVRYKFYRSTKSGSGYEAKSEKDNQAYVNTAGKKGTRYYYKARVMIYDAEGTLVTYTKLTQCNYACRIWSK